MPEVIDIAELSQRSDEAVALFNKWMDEVIAQGEETGDYYRALSVYLSAANHFIERARSVIARGGALIMYDPKTGKPSL